MHRTYRASARGAKSSPEEVIAAFRERCAEVMPLDFEAEPRAARCLDRGATLTGRLPLRGNFLMRVVEVAPRRVTLATVEGHPISGIVRFAADQVGGEVGFVVDVYARASNWLDRSAIALFGGALENLNWSSVARRGARLTRGHVARRVEKRVEKLRGREAEQVGGAIMDLVRSVERPATLS
ncbi:MAG: hypothetical protein H5U40_17010 [Polyangiaceae bacterium]|nr:hypothetical protein [Polyangiaceae bacterium]